MTPDAAKRKAVRNEISVGRTGSQEDDNCRRGDQDQATDGTSNDPSNVAVRLWLAARGDRDHGNVIGVARAAQVGAPDAPIALLVALNNAIPTPGTKADRLVEQMPGGALAVRRVTERRAVTFLEDRDDPVSADCRAVD